MNITLQPIIASWPFLAKALVMTIFISVASTALGFVIGTIVGTLRTFGGRAANIVLKADGTIEATGPTKIALAGAGSNSVQIAPAGVTVGGTSITSNAVGEHNIIGAVVRIN